ncbi:hypothetical protein H4582DRAFT_1977226 [Lactarius indigo]|nr:hypothetical protein H4582DRAFT_1977226 [Lactarius indigo]
MSPESLPSTTVLTSFNSNYFPIHTASTTMPSSCRIYCYHVGSASIILIQITRIFCSTRGCASSASCLSSLHLITVTGHPVVSPLLSAQIDIRLHHVSVPSPNHLFLQLRLYLPNCRQSLQKANRTRHHLSPLSHPAQDLQLSRCNSHRA